MASKYINRYYDTVEAIRVIEGSLPAIKEWLSDYSVIENKNNIRITDKNGWLFQVMKGDWLVKDGSEMVTKSHDDFQRQFLRIDGPGWLDTEDPNKMKPATNKSVLLLLGDETEFNEDATAVSGWIDEDGEYWSAVVDLSKYVIVGWSELPDEDTARFLIQKELEE